jgi:hypothetical protein
MDAVRTLERDLRGICGARLLSLIVYGERARATGSGGAHDGHDPASVRTMAIVEGLTATDLRGCAAHIGAWHKAGLATPLIVAAHEFERSLDVFPLEFGAIIADHTVVAGAEPFAALSVDPADLRRACEVQARSHLLHLRQGFLETAGRGDALALLAVESAPAFTALITSVARLEMAADRDPAAAARHLERTLAVAPGAIAEIVALVGVHEISSVRAEQLFPPYLDAVEKLVRYVDDWANRAQNGRHA